MRPMSICISLIIVGTVGAQSKSPLLTRKSFSPGNGFNLGVYDGKDTTIKKHPYQVLVKFDSVVLCAAIVLDTFWLLTSADCGNCVYPNEMTVLTGSNDGIHGQKYKVEKIVFNPNYTEGSLDYDYALIKLKKPLKWSDKVKPANITKNCPTHGTKFVVAGWGKTSPGGVAHKNGTFKEGSMTLQEDTFCKDYYKQYGFYLTDRMACAYNKGKTTLCPGDWAAGFVTQSKKEDGTIIFTIFYFFLAVASKGFCTSDAAPVILANVCVVYEWITKIIGDEVVDE